MECKDIEVLNSDKFLEYIQSIDKDATQDPETVDMLKITNDTDMEEEVTVKLADNYDTEIGSSIEIQKSFKFKLAGIVGLGSLGQALAAIGADASGGSSKTKSEQESKKRSSGKGAELIFKIPRKRKTTMKKYKHITKRSAECKFKFSVPEDFKFKCKYLTWSRGKGSETHQKFKDVNIADVSLKKILKGTDEIDTDTVVEKKKGFLKDKSIRFCVTRSTRIWDWTFWIHYRVGVK